MNIIETFKVNKITEVVLNGQFSLNREQYLIYIIVVHLFIFYVYCSQRNY